jgi:hypothetical protein
VSATELVAAVMRTLLRSEAERTPLRPPYERRVADRRASSANVPTSTERRLIDRRQGLSAYHSGTVN